MTVYYTDEHEWLLVEGETAKMGITGHAADQLGDIVFVEQKDAGEDFEKGDEIGLIESVKAASEIYAPIDCKVIEVNESLEASPGSINESPEADGWIYKIKISDPSQLEELMDKAAYVEMVS